MTERELERRAQRRLAVLRHVEEVSFNVAATCQYYGISRQCYYGWLRWAASRSDPRLRITSASAPPDQAGGVLELQREQVGWSRHLASDRIGPPMFADCVRTTWAAKGRAFPTTVRTPTTSRRRSILT